MRVPSSRRRFVCVHPRTEVRGYHNFRLSGEICPSGRQSRLRRRHPPEGRHNRNRLQANAVSAAGGVRNLLPHSARRAPQFA